MNYNSLFENIFREINRMPEQGSVADYIPELGKVDPDKFGVCLTKVNGEVYGFGDFEEKFSIQSIAKVLALAMAYRQNGEKLWERVGVEPSGMAFNSLVQLETNKGIPRNPLVNAGALVVSDILVSNLENPKEEFLSFVREVSGNEAIEFCPRIAESEKQFGYRNAALINLMKSFGNIKNDVDTVLDFYFNLCSIEMSCKDLSQTYLFLANKGISPQTGKKVLSLSRTKRVNAIMQVCGFYDEAGEFSFKVGLPGKSGVGGGIIAVHPGEYSIAVWSPKLNEKGNSYKGMKFLELFTTATGWSIF